MPAVYDFEDHEYTPKRDVEERKRIRLLLNVKEEWYVRESNLKHRHEIRICSHTHDDDVELILTGNFSKEQALAVAKEVCAQLNMAEKFAAREFDDDF